MKRNLSAIQAAYGVDVGEEFADITNGILLQSTLYHLSVGFVYTLG